MRLTSRIAMLGIMAGSGGLLGSLALTGASQAATCGSSQGATHGGAGPIYTSGANGVPALPPVGYAGVTASNAGNGGYLQVTGVTSTSGAVGNVTASGSAGGQGGGVAAGNDGNTNGTVEGQAVPTTPNGAYVCTQ